MEPDNDPQELALEIPPENAPVQSTLDSLGKAAKNTGEETQATGSPRPGLWQRLLEKGGWLMRHLRRFVQAGASWITAAGSGIWRRLRNRAETPQADGEDGRHGDDSSKSLPARKKPLPTPATEEIKVAAPRSLVRSVFLYLLFLVIGGIAGMTFSFALLFQMITNQAQKIGDQRDEIAQIENELSRIRQAEAKSRLENLEYQKKLSAAEGKLQSATQNLEKSTPSLASSGYPATPAKPPVAGKSLNCTLEPGKIGDNLTRCIDELNRK